MAHGRPRARVHRHGAAPDAGPGPRDWRRSPDTRPGRTHLGKFILILISVCMGNVTDVVLKCLQTELQRMMATINKINSETACAPDGMYVTDAAGNYVAKPGFFVRYPDQLSSYVAPTGNLGKAAPGTWCVYFYLFIFPIYVLLVWASILTCVFFFFIEQGFGLGFV